MSAGAETGSPRVAIVGGGLAGLAAAVALATSKCRVELFEARRFLGGRASSFRDPASGEIVDHCQHVSMACCTNLADFCCRTLVADCFRHDHVLSFIGPDGRASRIQAARWLPAPLHLAPSFMRLKFLSFSDRFRIARALWSLMREKVVDDPAVPTIGQWLARHRQTPAAIQRFWSVILVSALGEDLNRASLSAARKVLVDGFLAAADAYVLQVPKVPLGVLYGDRLERWLAGHGVTVHMGTAVRQIAWQDGPIVHTADGYESRPEYLVLAVPWSKVSELVEPQIAKACPWLGELSRIESAPITGVHLWFDRPIMPLPHAVLVGRLSQWIFNRGRGESANDDGHYYQVVISASRELAGRDRGDIVAKVSEELSAVWPEVAQAQLLRSRVVTQHEAVFSAQPGLERRRPSQRTSLDQLLLAGDWTATGWPATMEGAVRSGYLSAEAILRSLGRPTRFLVPDLPRGLLARWLIR